MRRAMDRIGRVLTALSVVCFTLMLLVSWYQIISRYTAVEMAQWTEEAARLFFIIAMFFGIVVAIHLKEHIIIDFFTGLVSKRFKKLMDFAFNLATLLFLAIMFRGAVSLSAAFWRASLVTIDTVTKGHLYAIEAVAVGLMFVYVLADMVVPSRSTKNGTSSEGAPL